ncbi:hypothetical protein pipiens_017270 [Culex pipiens pipiens]|uniref:Uncharacterized protein n=1 Tax=Culex pipiens pipiens TaxID=38569 RepID=A0ABD1CHE4_CULPP
MLDLRHRRSVQCAFEAGQELSLSHHNRIVEQLKTEIVTELRAELSSNFAKFISSNSLTPRSVGRGAGGSVIPGNRRLFDINPKPVPGKATDAPPEVTSDTCPPPGGFAAANEGPRFWLYLSRVSRRVTEDQIVKLAIDRLRTTDILATRLVAKGRDSYVAVQNIATKPIAADHNAATKPYAAAELDADEYGAQMPAAEFFSPSSATAPTAEVNNFLLPAHVSASSVSQTATRFQNSLPLATTGFGNPALPAAECLALPVGTFPYSISPIVTGFGNPALPAVGYLAPLAVTATAPTAEVNNFLLPAHVSASAVSQTATRFQNSLPLATTGFGNPALPAAECLALPVGTFPYSISPIWQNKRNILTIQPRFSCATNLKK